MNSKLMQPIKFIEQGVALLALLISLSIVAIALLAAAETWSVQRKRDMELDLLFTGQQYEQAIKHYYFSATNGPKVLPMRIEDLVEDNRFPVPVRHLRRAYLDPITNEPFELILEGERIIGVVSKSEQPTIKRTGFSLTDKKFDGVETYHQWKFIYRPPIIRKGSTKLSPQ